jgi:hypothetical protein
VYVRWSATRGLRDQIKRALGSSSRRAIIYMQVITEGVT